MVNFTYAITEIELKDTIINEPVCPIIEVQYRVKGATNMEPDAVPGLSVFTVTFIGRNYLSVIN